MRHSESLQAKIKAAEKTHKDEEAEDAAEISQAQQRIAQSGRQAAGQGKEVQRDGAESKDKTQNKTRK